MKHLYTTVLILHFLLEALAALSLIAGPGGIAAMGQGGQWSMHYGFAALALASISLWAWPHRENYTVATLVLGVFIVFHIGLTISLAVAGDQAAGMIGHAVMSVLSIIAFTARAKWCN